MPGSTFHRKPKTLSSQGLLGQKGINFIERIVLEMGSRWTLTSATTIFPGSDQLFLAALAADPDVRIQEEFSGKLQNKVAIEIKGGTDKSNAHNRAGEAEKSHQKAKGEGFRDFWTIIAKKGLDIQKLGRESPTTNSWFDAAQVLGRNGEDWEEFRNRIAGQVGIPLATEKQT